ncbi:MAG: hypothetical protein CR982_06720 [Candidatus Cloacimonadota bacterium]|nr:MAG: hypothetical protein CR982_06720 [Candidatus Cloacimonadota bacterium]PIE77824.1 MAG: hypothetical protein CSA15_11045 [Candidatus Delongbacteria bacterium]
MRTLIFILLLYLSKSLCGYEFENVKSVTCELDSSYGKIFYQSAVYNPKKESIFFIAKSGRDLNKKVKRVCSFNLSGNFLGTIGKINSFEAGGYVDPFRLSSFDNRINIYDIKAKRVTSFNIDNFSSEKLIYLEKSAANCESFFLRDDKFYASNNNCVFSSLNSGIVYKIRELEIKNNYELDEYITFDDCTPFRKFYGFEGELPKDPLISSNEIYKTLSLYQKTYYAPTDSGYFAVNGFGSILYQFDINDSLTNTYHLKSMKKFRESEKKVFKNFSKNPINRLSSISSIFYDPKGNNLYIVVNHISKKIKKEFGSSFSMLTFSLDSGKEKFEAIPDGFIGIKDGLFIGFKKSDLGNTSITFSKLLSEDKK